MVASAGSASGLGSPAILFGHEAGSALCGRGAVAPARRVALGIDAAGFAGMGRATPQATRLLTRSRSRSRCRTRARALTLTLTHPNEP